MSAHKKVTFAASYRSVALSFIPLKNRRTAIISIPNRISSANVPKLSLPRRRSSALLSSGVRGCLGGGVARYVVVWGGGKASDWSNCNSDEWIR